jgi:hypothetical protein
VKTVITLSPINYPVTLFNPLPYRAHRSGEEDEEEENTRAVFAPEAGVQNK